MKLDTGVGISIISKETRPKYFPGVPLEPSTTQLHAYTGDSIHVRCQCQIQVPVRSNSGTVVAGVGPSLLGRAWLTKIRLDWNKIFRIHVTET